MVCRVSCCVSRGSIDITGLGRRTLGIEMTMLRELHPHVEEEARAGAPGLANTLRGVDRAFHLEGMAGARHLN